MSFTLNVTSDIDKVMDRVAARYKEQIPFATAFAITRTVREAKFEVDKKLPEIFDRPTPFTRNAIGYQAATKQTLTGKVFIKDIQAKYLALEITGGERRPTGRALVLPTDYPTDQYGNLPRTAVKQLLRRADVFSGKVRGIPGIWQRTGHGLTLLISYAAVAHYQPRFDFAGIVQKVVAARIQVNLIGALNVAVATAK